MRFDITLNHKLDRSINRSIRDRLTAAEGRSRGWLAAPRHRALSRCPPTSLSLCARVSLPARSLSARAVCVCAARVNRHIATRADSIAPIAQAAIRRPGCAPRLDASAARSDGHRRGDGGDGSEGAGRRRSAAVCVADAGLLELRSTSSRMMDVPQRARPTRQRDWRLREGLRSRGGIRVAVRAAEPMSERVSASSAAATATRRGRAGGRARLTCQRPRSGCVCRSPIDRSSACVRERESDGRHH